MSLNQKNPSFFYKLTFCTFGLSSIISWSAVLSSLYYFADRYGSSVFLTFTLLFQVGNVLFALLMPFIARIFKPVTIITYGFTFVIFLLITMMVLAEFATQKIGYSISVAISFILGCLNSVIQNSMIVLGSQQGEILNGLYWIFTAYSGLSMSFLALALNFLFNGVPNSLLYSTLVYFLLAFFIISFCIYLTFKYKKMSDLEQSQETSMTQQQQQQQPLLNENIRDEEFTNTNSINSSNHQLSSKNQLKSFNISNNNVKQFKKNQQNMQEEEDAMKQYQLPIFQEIKRAISHVGWIPFHIFFIFVVTFGVFPKVMLSQVYFTTPFLKQNNQLNATLLLNFTFSVFEVVGKTLGTYKIFQKKLFLYILVLVRVIFLVTSTLIAKQVGGIFNSEYFPFVNIGLFATSLGIACSGLMTISPKQADHIDNPVLRKKIISEIGMLNTFSLLFGINLGSWLAIPLSAAI